MFAFLRNLEEKLIEFLEEEFVAAETFKEKINYYRVVQCNFAIQASRRKMKHKRYAQDKIYFTKTQINKI